MPLDRGEYAGAEKKGIVGSEDEKSLYSADCYTSSSANYPQGAMSRRYLETKRVSLPHGV